MAPPRVVAVALLELPEGVDEAGIHEILEPLPLLVGEALLTLVRSRIGQIQLGVRDIQIAAEDDGLATLQLHAVREEGRIPRLMAQGTRLRSSLAFGV